MDRYISEYMLKRQIQKTGGSSYSIILPKDWIIRNRLNNKDELYVYELTNNDLLVRSTKRKKNNSVTIDVDKYSLTEHLYREVLGYYVTGYDEIIPKSKTQFNSDVRNIRKKINEMMFGFETFYENSDTAILRNVSSNNLTAREYLLKMAGNIKYMYSDLEKASWECDMALAEDIINRDAEIDRVNFLIMRKFRQQIESLGTNGTENQPLAVSLYDERRALKLERISDHIVNMATIITNHCEDIKKEDKALKSSLDKGKKYIELCEKIITTDSKKTAHSILDNYKYDRDPLRNLNAGEHSIDLVTCAFQYSINRIVSYTANMAKEVINFAELPKHQ